MTAKSWKLDRYARFVHTEQSKDGEWKHYDESRGPLILVITDMNQLVISQESTFLESHSLVSARVWMRGLARNDSLLFIYKFQKETRRFRIRFCRFENVSGADICNNAVQQLSQYFIIKISTTDLNPTSAHCHGQECGPSASLNMTTSDSQSQPHKIANQEDQTTNDTILEGEVTLGAMAQTIVHGQGLPQAYYSHQSQPEVISQLLRLCLADPAFPAFVEAVDTELKAIIAGD